MLRVLDEAEASPRVVALGGGAVTSEAVRRRLAGFAHVVWLEAPLDDLWRRAAGGETASRPLARDREVFARLLEQRAAALRGGVAPERVRLRRGGGRCRRDGATRSSCARTGLCADRAEGER